MLARDGYFIRERFAGEPAAEAALQVVSRLPLRRARVGHEQLDGVRGDEIAWVDEPAIHARFEELRNDVNRNDWLGLTRFEVQVARYLPGAFYPRHRDAFRGARSRRLTAIWYLNREPRGGALRLHVDPPIGERLARSIGERSESLPRGGAERLARSIDIEPTFDRLVVFLSEEIDHEVLPAESERWAITAWFY